MKRFASALILAAGLFTSADAGALGRMSKEELFSCIYETMTPNLRKHLVFYTATGRTWPLHPGIVVVELIGRCDPTIDLTDPGNSELGQAFGDYFLDRWLAE